MRCKGGVAGAWGDTHNPHVMTNATNVPNVETAGTSEKLVRTKAHAVVNDVTDIALTDLLQLHWNRVSRDPLTILGCARDCFHVSQKTKMLSVPMPRMM